MAKMREFASLTDDELDDGLRGDCDEWYDEEDDAYYHKDDCRKCKLERERNARDADKSGREPGGFVWDCFDHPVGVAGSRSGYYLATDITVGTLARYSPVPGSSDSVWAEAVEVDEPVNNVIKVVWRLTNTDTEFYVVYDCDDELDLMIPKSF